MPHEPLSPGSRPSAHPVLCLLCRENRSILAELLAESFVSILPVTPAVARRCGRLFADLRRAGTPIPINDVWFAATVFDCGGHLLTFESDFGHVASLDCTILTP